MKGTIETAVNSMSLLQIQFPGAHKKLNELGNNYVYTIVQEYTELCQPDEVIVLTGTPDEINYVHEQAVAGGEEHQLAIDGHTYHFDGPNDQGRAVADTIVLNNDNREERLKEMSTLLPGIMRGKKMFISFYSWGPSESPLSIPIMQISDSAYLIDTANRLYRPGFNLFQKSKNTKDFFHFIHSSGELTNTGVSANIDSRRIFIDPAEKRAISLNNQYAGNSSFKKLAFRLSIFYAMQDPSRLSEHMALFGVKAQYKDRMTYFCLAARSGCGKTSSAMLHSLVGDDITTIYIDSFGQVRGFNVEDGFFGILDGVTAKSDPLIWKALTTADEVIFSNVLVAQGKPYWLNMGVEFPAESETYFGHWIKGQLDNEGKAKSPAHGNARSTMKLKYLSNVDPHLHDKDGVQISGIVYSVRDPDTTPPVMQSRNWNEGVFMGAALESETTATTIGKSGERVHDPMAITDFLIPPLGDYLKKHFSFGKSISKPPQVFSVNYFRKDKKGNYLNDKLDKKVWFAWMEGRIHGEFETIDTPIGLIPKFEDLRKLFKSVLNKEYKKQDYEEQFTIRISQLLEKLDRIERIYRAKQNIPPEIFDQISSQRKRLQSH